VSFQLHPEARNEFREAVLFYGRAAERFVNAVETAIAAIILRLDRFREFERANLPGFEISLLDIVHFQRARHHDLSGQT
jgi:hypothetical protein